MLMLPGNLMPFTACISMKAFWVHHSLPLPHPCKPGKHHGSSRREQAQIKQVADAANNARKNFLASHNRASDLNIVGAVLPDVLQ
jgi:hypothetical protein